MNSSTSSLQLHIPDDIYRVRVTRIVIWCSSVDFQLWNISLCFASTIRHMHYLQIVYALPTSANPGSQYGMGYGQGSQAPTPSTITFRPSPDLFSVSGAIVISNIPFIHNNITVSDIVAVMRLCVPGHIPSLTSPRINHGWISRVLNALSNDAGYLPTDIFPRFHADVVAFEAAANTSIRWPPLLGSIPGRY